MVRRGTLTHARFVPKAGLLVKILSQHLAVEGVVLELIAKVAMGCVAFFRGGWRRCSFGRDALRHHSLSLALPASSEKATRRAGVLSPCGLVARSSRSFGSATH